ncbi:exonuclease domain-containing protein [Massilia orientalis]|uniref:exonuclease domain-containing protein n=1 Tax=Massilia orientalis TaxID=3050128 RepID=UPI0037DDD40B
MEPAAVATQERVDPLVGRASVIDTETTGTNVRTDRVISFGHVRLIDGKVAEKVEWFFNPGDVEIHPDALRVHGITAEFLADKPPIKGYLAQIIELMVEAIVCGHNVKFDMDMLNAELARHRFPPLEKFIAGVFDTMKESRERWPGKPASLDALCARVGLSTAHREKHGALTDALLCAEAMQAMFREQRSFLELFADTAAASALDEGAAEMPSVLVLPASADELAAHTSYLAGMSGDAPIWHRYTAAAAVDPDEELDEQEERSGALTPC